MKFFPASFLAVVLACCASASADDCAPTGNLAKDLGPVYNQGEDLNSCFANTAADQLTQKMHREKLLRRKDRIQPLALWAVYSLDDRRVPNESKHYVSTPNNLLTSLYGMKKRGLSMLCRESEFGKTADSSHPLFAQADAERMAKFRAQLETPSVGPCELDEATTKALDRQADEIRNAAYFLWWNTLKKTCRTKIPNMSWNWYWQEDRTAGLKKGPQKRRTPASNRALVKEMDAALDRGAIAGIEYQAGLFLREKKSFVHWSNVVERKPVGQKCFYRIRDSFGENCDRYRKVFRCEKGYIWVERETLVSQMDAVSSLR